MFFYNSNILKGIKWKNISKSIKNNKYWKNISKYSAEDLDRIVSKLNDLERKKLNYYTPYMKMLEEYDSIEGTELLFNLQTAVNN